MNRLVALTLSVLFAGCQATGAIYLQPQIGSQQGEVVVYRPGATVDAAAYPNIYINDKNMGSLMNSGFKSFILSPGTYSFALYNPMAWNGKQEWAVTVSGGERKYFRLDTSLKSMQIIGTVVTARKDKSIMQISGDIAIPELRTMKESN